VYLSTVITTPAGIQVGGNQAADLAG